MLPSKQDVKNAMLQHLRSGRAANGCNERHTVKRIRSDLNSYYNSLNILTGQQGKGKTFAALNEIITLSYLPETHIIIYVKKKDYDETVEAIRELSAVPIIDVGYESVEDENGEIVKAGAVETCKRIFEYKTYYNKIRRDAVERGISPENIEAHINDKDAIAELFETLRIDDFTRPWLNTLILFDDGGNSGLFARKDGYFNNVFKLLRDVNAIVFITIHGMTQLLPSIKENCAVVYIGKGLSADRVAIIHRQTNNPIEYQEFMRCYQIMNRDPSKHVLVVDNVEGVLRME
jgi:hypothetical protein